MSTENTNTGATGFTQLPIVKRIMIALNLGDEGRVGHFFNRIIKKAERQITALESNKDVLKLEYKNDMIDIDERIEDAEINLESTYSTPDITRLTTNADQDAYEEVYLNRIERAEDTLESVKLEKERLQTSHKESLENLDTQIGAYKKRISNFKK